MHHVIVFRPLPVLSVGLMMPSIGVGGGGWGALGCVRLTSMGAREDNSRDVCVIDVDCNLYS